MKTITTETNVYKFEELSDEGKENALNNLWDLNVDYEWWDCTYEDAAQIGMEITEFDLDRNRYCKANIYDPQKTAELILQQHGDCCDTFKLAKSFLEEITPKQVKYDRYDNMVERWGDNLHSCHIHDLKCDLSDEIDLLEKEFKRDLCDEYANMLQKEYEYLTGEEAITESIEANDYGFTEDGELF